MLFCREPLWKSESKETGVFPVRFCRELGLFSLNLCPLQKLLFNKITAAFLAMKT